MIFLLHFEKKNVIVLNILSPILILIIIYQVFSIFHFFVALILGSQECISGWIQAMHEEMTAL